MNTSMVKDILHSLVERLETVGSGEIPVTPPGASPAPRIPEVDEAGDIPLDDDKPQIDYEAVGADEVEVKVTISAGAQKICFKYKMAYSLQIGEMYEVPEENDSEVEIVEEGEVILSEEDSDDAGCVQAF